MVSSHKLSGGDEKVTILNAFQSPFSGGWADYAPFVSNDGENWKRIKPGKYTGKEFIFEIS